ncbi:MAG: heparinase II/III family protein [Cellulosilyticaceae bacterium]
MSYLDQLPLITEEKCLEIANELLGGKLIVHETNKEYAVFTLAETINWGIEVQRAPNTYQLFLQGLNPIAFLCKAYQISLKDHYLRLAGQLVKSWYDYASSKPQNAFLWNDHAVAMRVENLLCFASIATQSKGIIGPQFIMKVNSLIKEHAAYLYEDAYYTFNHNHGIIQDCALIDSSYYLNDNESPSYLERAKKRLCMQLEYGFNQENVHIENSPGYQSEVLMLLEQLARLMNLYHDPFGAWLMEQIRPYNEFLVASIKPNVRLGEIGDTSSFYGIKEKNLAYRLDNPQLLYATTYGKEGNKPTDNTKIYPKSGYYFYRSSWAQEDFERATWVAFKAGYQSKTHKHADDLSFMLYSKGVDIFVDPGWYNYVYGDPLREYFISAHAHNTVIVDGKTYSPTVANAYKTGILKYETTRAEYDYILAFNKMYEGVQIDRHFYYLKQDSILVYDDIVSDKEHTYSQLFHLSEAVQIISRSDTEVLLKIKHTPYRVRVIQLIKETTLEVYHGDPQKKYGHISRGINCSDQIDTLKFDRIGTSQQFLTLITVEDETGHNLAYEQYQYEAIFGKLTLRQKNNKYYEIELKERMRVKILGCETEMIEIDVIKLSLKIEGDIPVTCAWYILEESDGNVEYKQSYSEECVLEYQFKKKKNYIVKVYLKSEWGEVIREVVAQIKYADGYYQNVTHEIFHKELRIDSCRVEQMGPANYRFEIVYEYFWKVSVKWYIYRNGSYYKMIRHNSTLTYEFKEPGVYTVMYYIRTLNGEEEFWTVPPIQIN